MTRTAQDVAIAGAADEADAICDLVNRMSVGNPEVFAMQRNLIAVKLRALAKQIRGDARVKATHVWRAPNVRRA